MKIIQITPGTGNFYCGVCIRDHSLVTALRKRGHDALMIPMYLPLVPDDPSQKSDAPIFFGGINVYLQQKFPIFRKTPRWLDRLLDFPGLLGLLSSMANMTQAKGLGEMTVSMLCGEDGRQVKELERLVDWLKELGDIAVISLSNALLIGLVRRMKRELGAPVICALQGEDDFLDDLPQPERDISWNTLAERAKEVDAFVAPSHYYAKRMLSRLRLPENKVHVIPNGIVVQGYEPAPETQEPPVLGYLARLCETKGLGMLVDAFILLKETGKYPTLKLRAAGTMTSADAQFVKRMQARLASKDLAQDAEFLPDLTLEAKKEFLKSLSVFSVPALCSESFGLYVIEALAAGVPVVEPNQSAFPEILEQTGGGVLFENKSVASLVEKIDSLLSNPEEAHRMGQQGRACVLEHFTAEAMAERYLALIEEIK